MKRKTRKYHQSQHDKEIKCANASHGKREASRGQVYVPPPVELPTTDDGESKFDGNRNRKEQKKPQNADDNRPTKAIGSATNEKLLNDIRSKLTKELKQIDEIKDHNSKDRRSAKRKAGAVAAEDAGMSRVDFLQWCETTTNVVQSAEQKDDETHHRKVAAEKLLAALESIEHDTDRNAEDRLSSALAFLVLGIAFLVFLGGIFLLFFVISAALALAGLPPEDPIENSVLDSSSSSCH